MNPPDERSDRAQASPAPGEPKPFERRSYEAGELLKRYPPFMQHPNKKVLYSMACPRDAVHNGSLEYSRWAHMPLPEECDLAAAGALVEVRDGYFDYAPCEQAADPASPAPAGVGPVVEWHVNFADPKLFGFYGSAFFAQDEIQVAEHPALAALRQALLAIGMPAITLDERSPTPALVAGVERRLAISTRPDRDRGLPYGLYGRSFANAGETAVRSCARVLDPPTISNILAMCAPRGGHGAYAAPQVQHILDTAYTGFRAAVLESAGLVSALDIEEDARVIVHSGFWGCGAFGGNRVMMSLLQIVAAQMAGLHRLVLHVGDPSGRLPVEQALGLARDLSAVTSTHNLIVRLPFVGLEWGVSDGQ
jgi:hypothetical protein